jgi:hypothetical protein
LWRGEVREQCDKSGEQSVGAEDLVFHGGGVWVAEVGSGQISVGRVRKSEVGVGNSRLHAENDIAAAIVVCARAGRRKTPAVAVRDVDLRPVMTRAKVRSERPNNKAFNVKLS